MAFSDLQKRKNKTFLEKQYVGVRAIIEQISYGAFLKGKKVAILNRTTTTTKINKANCLKSFYRKKKNMKHLRWIETQKISSYLCTIFPLQSALRLGGKPMLKKIYMIYLLNFCAGCSCDNNRRRFKMCPAI